ncbi:hypothetical protein K7A41_05780 [Sphingobacterium sp. InxBP1]|nr:hypothetical protein [Sphingobacterium sp. InxBP1]MCW8310723.1 hypothetical protein [Sphingobacterium sp. InxBP1]
MKNLNLESLGVQELNAKEMVEIEGGKLVDWLKVIGAAITLAVAIISGDL